jgi:hypothetical protein
MDDINESLKYYNYIVNHINECIEYYKTQLDQFDSQNLEINTEYHES